MGRKKLPAEPFEVDAGPLDREGRALADHGDRRLTVHGALPGETVQARYLFGRRFRGQAETLEVLSPAPSRVPPACPHFGTCGACALQHLGTEGQLAFKQDLLAGLLDDAGVQPAAWLAPLDGGRWHYRRKARLSLRDVRKKEKTLLGFRERDGRFVTDMSECHVLSEPVVSCLPQLTALVQELEGRARIPQIEVACGDEAAVLILRHLDPLADADVDRLARFQAESGLGIWLQSKGPDTAAPLNGDSPVELAYSLPDEDLVFRFHPLDFFQVNAPLNQLMVRQALHELDLSSTHRVLDLFCGLGNFTLPIARHAGEVVGLEGAEAMTQRAAENALHNCLTNTRFAVADLYAEQLSVAWPAGHFDRVLLDPPRSGALQVLPAVAETAADRVVYVSCNPETLARDAAELVSKHGYRLKSAGIMDMFPHTAHVESMAVFERV